MQRPKGGGNRKTRGLPCGAEEKRGGGGSGVGGRSTRYCRDRRASERGLTWLAGWAIRGLLFFLNIGQVLVVSVVVAFVVPSTYLPLAARGLGGDRVTGQRRAKEGRRSRNSRLFCGHHLCECRCWLLFLFGGACVVGLAEDPLHPPLPAQKQHRQHNSNNNKKNSPEATSPTAPAKSCLVIFTFTSTLCCLLRLP